MRLSSSRLPLLRVTCLIHFLKPTTYETSHHNAGFIFNTRGYVRTVLCEIVLPSCFHHSTGVIFNIITRAKRTTLLRQNFVMSRLCYGSAEQVNLLCSHLNRKVPFSPFRFQFFSSSPRWVVPTVARVLFLIPVEIVGIVGNLVGKSPNRRAF